MQAIAMLIWFVIYGHKVMKCTQLLKEIRPKRSCWKCLLSRVAVLLFIGFMIFVVVPA